MELSAGVIGIGVIGPFDISGLASIWLLLCGV